MKIDQTHGLGSINPYKSQLARRNESTAQEKASGRDVVDISAEALQLQGNNSRTEKVDALKKQMDAGEYQVDPKAVAKKMVAYYRNRGGIDSP